MERKERSMSDRCLICKKIIATNRSEGGAEEGGKGSFFPFCSERCRLIDLGKWLDSNYRICEEKRDGVVEEGKTEANNSEKSVENQ